MTIVLEDVHHHQKQPTCLTALQTIIISSLAYLKKIDVHRLSVSVTLSHTLAITSFTSLQHISYFVIATYSGILSRWIFSLQNVTFFATLVSNLECHLQFKSSFMVLLVRHAWRRYVSDRFWGKNPEEKKLILAKSHYMIKKPLRPKKQQEEPSRSPPAQLRIWLTLNKVFRISSEIRYWLVYRVLLKTL